MIVYYYFIYLFIYLFIFNMATGKGKKSNFMLAANIAYIIRRNALGNSNRIFIQIVHKA